MKTKILTIMFLLLSFTGIAAAQNVSIQDASVAAGGTVIVPIMINSVTDAGAANINLIYNKDVVNVISVNNSAFDTMFSNINNATGITTIGAFQVASPGLNGNVKLADITLKAVGSGGQSSQLNLSVTTLKTVGNVPIVASLNNGTFTITGVGVPVLTTIMISPTTASDVVGDTTPFTAVPKDQFGNNMTGITVTWNSSNTTVGTINSAGVFTALAAGTSTITARNGSIVSNIATETVTPVPVLTTIMVSPTTASDVVGDTTPFTAVPKDQFGNNMTGITVTWNSSNTTVGTINSAGVFTALAAGTSNITARNGSIVSNIATETVTPAPVLTTIMISPTTASDVVGDTTPFTAVPKDQFGNNMTGITVTWNSSNTTVGTINSAGVFTALAAGTSNITARNGSIVSNIATETVTAPVLTTIMISPTTASDVVGDTTPFTAVPKDQNGNNMTGITVTWNSSNTTVGTINSAGVFTALAAGTSNITARNGSIVSNIATETVTPAPVLTTIMISPTTASDVVGDTTPFTAVPKDQFGNNMTGITVTWNSSNTTVGTINSAGVFTALAAGTSNITARNGSIVSNIATETVTPAPVLTTIMISPTTASDVVGDTTPFTAVPKDQFGNNMTGITVTWNSSNTTVGTINSAGVFTALAAGTSNITARNGSIVSNAAVETVTTSTPTFRVDDVALFQSNGWWALKYDFNSITNGTADKWIPFGNGTSQPVVGDFRNTGTPKDVAILQSNGWWAIKYDFANATNGSADKWIAFGDGTAKPVVGDFDHDGFKDDVALLQSNGWWAIKYNFNSATNGTADKWIPFGNGSAKPVIGDFNGDGFADDVAIYQSNGWWAIKCNFNSITNGTADKWLPFGDGTGQPVVGDFERSGTQNDVAIFQSNGWWAIKYNFNSATNGTADKWLPFGDGTAQPVVGNFNNN